MDDSVEVKERKTIPVKDGRDFGQIGKVASEQLDAQTKEIKTDEDFSDEPKPEPERSEDEVIQTIERDEYGEIKEEDRDIERIKADPVKYYADGFRLALRRGEGSTHSRAIAEGYIRDSDNRRDAIFTSRDPGATPEVKIELKIIKDIPKIIDHEAIIEARTEGLKKELSLGVFYRETDDGNEAVYTIPPSVRVSKEAVSPQIEKFYRRYGGRFGTEKSVAEYLTEDCEIDLKSEELREASYAGFANILISMESQDDPDTGILGWYFDNLDYGNNIEEAVEAISQQIAGHSRAQAIFRNFLATQKAYGEYRSQQEADNDQPFAADVEEVIIKEADPEEAREVRRDSTTAAAISVVKKEFGFSDSDITDGIVMAVSGGMKSPQSTQKKYSGRRRGNGRIDSPTDIQLTIKEANREIMAKAKEIAVLCQRDIIKKSGIDPEATVIRTIDSDTSAIPLIILRFGCDGYNHVVAERGDGKDGALYSWAGQGDEEWKEIFCSGKTATEIRKSPNVRVHNHRGDISGLAEVHNRAIESLAARKTISADKADQIIEKKVS